MGTADASEKSFKIILISSKIGFRFDFFPLSDRPVFEPNGDAAKRRRHFEDTLPVGGFERSCRKK
jgi:hypothetical protein